MEESKNDKVQIAGNLELLFYNRFQRELGVKAPINKEVIKNRRQSFVFMNLFSNQFPIEDFPSLEELESKFIDTLNREYRGLPVDVFEQLIFSILKTFNYSTKNNIVNQRLSLFCLSNILYCSKFSFIENKNTSIKKLFSHFLFFSQNSESFIENFKLNPKDITYQDIKIDIINYNTLYFKFLVENKNRLEYGDQFTDEELLFLKDTFADLFSNIFLKQELEFDKANPFNITYFFELYKSDKEQFYKELESHISYYILSSWEECDNRTSCYYGKNIIPEIEDCHLEKRKRYNKRKKIYAEQFVDSYLFYVINTQREIEELKDYVSNRSYNFLHFIIQSHPFIKRDIDRREKLNLG